MSANNGNKQQKDSTESVKKALEQKTGAEWEAFKQRLDLLQKIGALQQPDAFDQRLKELQKKTSQAVDELQKATSPEIRAANSEKLDACKRRLKALEKEMKDLADLNAPNDFERFRDRLLNPPDFKVRQFATYKDQIDILKKRKCIPNNSGVYEDKLRSVTYYRLKGYLQNPRGGYLPFETACHLHEFDALMRSLLSYAVSKVELYLRAQFSYVFCHPPREDDKEKVADPYAYLKAENYGKGGYQNTLGSIQKAVNRNKGTLFVRHYLDNSGGIMPLWVVMELLQFGELVTFYKNWTPHFQEELLQTLYGKGERYRSAEKTNGKSMRFISWLESCNYLRNACAHSGRLYNRPFTQLPNFPDEFKLEAERKKKVDTKGKECRGKKDFLWGAVLALQFLYPNQDEWSEIVKQIKRLLKEYASKAGGEKFLLSGLGFPDDWADWLLYWWSDMS